MSVNQILSANLKKIRRHLKVKAAQVAKNAHITRQYYSDIERSKTSPSLAVVQALAETLNVPVWLLFKENGAEEWISASNKSNS